MPTRIIRDGILDSEAINSLSESCELFYRRLMSLVDDYGRYEANPDVLRAKLFALQLDRWPTERVKSNLAALGESRCTSVGHGDSPLVTVYEVGGKKYLQINNFGQRVQSKEKYPSPDSRKVTVIHGDSPSSRSRSRSRISESETQSASVRDVRDRFSEWLDGYQGRKAQPDQACRVWLSRINTPEDEAAAFACRDRYNASDEVARGITKEAHNFLTEQSDNRWAGQWAKATGTVAPARRLVI